MYSIEEDRWYSSATNELEPMPIGVQGAGWTLHDGQIFCFGGKTEHMSGWTDAVQIYDIARNGWTQRDPMPVKRSKLAEYYPVVDDQYVYLFGGDNEESRVSRQRWNWQYNLNTDTWDRAVNDAPYAQSFPCCTLHDGWLYYATGNTQQKGVQNDYPGALTQRYHPATDRWQVVSPCPHPVTDGSGDKWGSCISWGLEYQSQLL